MAARSKRQHAQEHENNERWLLTYADLIALLMVFFVVMYAMSRADVSKFAKLQAALQRAFRVEVLKGDVPTSLQGEDGSNDQRSVLQDENSYPAATVLDTKLVSTLDDLRIALLQLPEASSQSANIHTGIARDGIVISLSGN